MARHGALIAAILLAVPLGVAISLEDRPARAQDAPPGRNANIYNGTAHQPDAGSTTAQEKAAGIAPSSEQQSHDADTVEQLGRAAQQKAQQAGPATAGCDADGKNCARP